MTAAPSIQGVFTDRKTIDQVLADLAVGFEQG